MSTTGSAGLTAGELRRARRAFVLAQHPDRGGDPTEFTVGLARFALLLDQLGQGTAARPGPTTDPASSPVRRTHTGAPARVVVIRSPRGVAGLLRHLTGAAGRRRLRPVRHLR